MGTSSSIQATRVQNQQEASELSEATHTWSETASFDAALVRQATAKLLETVLKNDHFEAIQKLPEVIAGAPNFRRSKASSASPIFGTGQPTTEGFLDLINWLANKGFKKIYWTCLRQEPVVYVNGEPFTPREYSGMNENMQFKNDLCSADGIEVLERVMLQRLIAVTSAVQAGVSDAEASSMNMEGDLGGCPKTMCATFRDTYAEHPEDRTNVRTVLPVDEMASLSQVWAALTRSGVVPSMVLLRLPIADETAPQPEYLDQLFDTLKDEVFTTDTFKACCVFNCQMGKGRTTTGMVCATLIAGRHASDAAFAASASASAADRRPSQAATADAGSTTDAEPSDGGAAAAREVLRRSCRYQVIASLMRSMREGEEAKRRLDAAIGECDAMQNLRESIMWTYDKAAAEPTDERKAFWKSCGRNFIERYAVLLCFTHWILEGRNDAFVGPFAEYMGKYAALIKEGKAGFEWK